MDIHNNIFDYMAKLNFPGRLDLTHNKPSIFYTTPNVDVITENTLQGLNLNISLKGVGVQLVTIQELTKEDNFE